MKNQKIMKSIKLQTLQEIIKNALELYDMDRTQSYDEVAEAIAQENEVSSYKPREKIYIKDLNKFETYEKIYKALQEEAQLWAEDNCRIDSDTIYAFLDAFDDDEISQLRYFENFNLDDIKFVTLCISEHKEIYLEDNYE